MIRQHEFLEEAENKDLHARFKALQRDPPVLLELREKVARVGDRAAHLFGEERQEQRHIQQAPFGLQISPGHVQHIADGGEDVKRDAQRQDDVQGRPRLPCEAERRGHEEIQVFEHAEDEHQRCDREDGQPVAGLVLRALDGQSRRIGQQDYARHAQAEADVVQTHRHIAEDQQYELGARIGEALPLSQNALQQNGEAKQRYRCGIKSKIYKRHRHLPLILE